MKLQVIQDGYGKNTGVFIPINEWKSIVKKHKDLKSLVTIDQIVKPKLSQLAGKLSHKTAKAMIKHVAESRNEWELRLDK